MIKIFEDDDTAHQVLSHVVASGIAGVAGMRTAVRNRLSEIRTLVDNQDLQGLSALATVHHPYSELAVVFDEEIYTLCEAKLAVVNAYDRQLADQGLWPLPIDR